MKDAPWRAAVAAGLAVALVLTVQAAAAPPRVAAQARGNDATVHRQIASQKEKGLPLRGFSPPWLDP
jgi:hypothetical protein